MKSKIVGAALGILISGIVIGAVGACFVMKARMSNALEGGPLALGRLVFSNIDHELHLAPEQKQALAKSLALIQTQLLNLRRERQPEFEKIVSQGLDEFQNSLSNDQKEKLVLLRAKARSKLEIKAEHYPDAQGAVYLSH